MQTQLIDGATPLPHHNEIDSALTAEADPWGGGGNRMRIALIGPDGGAYAVVVTDGMGEWMGAVSALKLKGLIDLNRNIRVHNVPCDACFGLGA